MAATLQEIDNLISHLEAMQGAKQRQRKATPARRSHWREETTGFPDGASPPPQPTAKDHSMGNQLKKRSGVPSSLLLMMPLGSSIRAPPYATEASMAGDGNSAVSLPQLALTDPPVPPQGP